MISREIHNQRSQPSPCTKKANIFYLGFTARTDYVAHFESRQSLGGAKTEDPPEKTLDYPHAELGLSHM